MIQSSMQRELDETKAKVNMGEINIHAVIIDAYSTVCICNQ